VLAIKAAPAIKEQDGCFTVRVRGGQYPSNMGIARCELYCLFAPGDELKLIPEPDKPEDEYAIAVWGTDPLGQDLHLGYVQVDFAASITQQELKRRMSPTAWVLKKYISEHNGREMLIIRLICIRCPLRRHDVSRRDASMNDNCIDWMVAGVNGKTEAERDRILQDARKVQ
jgi:hypothetical protein